MEARALTQSHHDCTPTPRARLISPGGNGKGRVQSGEERRMVSLHLLGDACCCLGVMRPLSNEFTRRWEPDVPAVEPVEHQSRCAIRATETEWHRNRSVATSRGAWLPALICMGGFAQRQERHERRSCWMPGERGGERWDHWNSRDLALTDLCNQHQTHSLYSCLLMFHRAPFIRQAG